MSLDCGDDRKSSAATCKSSSSSETRSNSPWKKKKFSFAEREIAEQIYNHTVGASEGFDSVPNLDLDSDLCGAIRPYSVDYKDAIIAANFAIKEYNKKLGNEECLILERIVKVNMALVAGLLVYLTLEARQGSQIKTSFYEALVYIGIKDHIDLQLFRPAIHYKG